MADILWKEIANTSAWPRTLGATRRLLGYLLRSFAGEIDVSRVGKDRHANLATELGGALRGLAKTEHNALAYFHALCERFCVDPQQSRTRLEAPMAVWFPADGTFARWDRVVAALDYDLVRQAVDENPDLYATFATARRPDDPQDDEAIWASLDASGYQPAPPSPFALPDSVIRRPHLFAVLTVEAPLQHGSDSKNGNLTALRRETALDPLTGRRSELPFYGGNALRGQLRDLAFVRYLELLRLTTTEIPPHLAHSMLAGGTIEAGADTAGVLLDVRQAARALCPPWDLLGGNLLSQSMEGSVCVNDAVLVCRENAWLVHPYVAHAGESVEALAARLPPAESLVVVRQETRQAHRDIPGSKGLQMITQIETLMRGARLVSTISLRRLRQGSEVTRACLADLLESFCAVGQLGARGAVGRGQFSTSGFAPTDGQEPLPPSDLYVEWAKANGDAARAWCLRGGAELRAESAAEVATAAGPGQVDTVTSSKGKGGRKGGKATAAAAAPIAPTPEAEPEQGPQGALF